MAHHAPRLAPSVDAIQDGDFIDEQSLNLAVAHDGSISARACVSLATDHFFKKKSNTTVDILHVFDLSKQDSCPRNYKRDTIESELKP